MIAFHAQGGLGNQLFQYATARALAQRRATKLVIDASWYSPKVAKTTPRTLDLLACRIDARLADATESTLLEGLRTRLRSRLPFGRPFRPRREPRGFDAGLRDAPDGSYLIGYWQSWRYFDDIRPLLLDELRPRVAPAGADAEFAAQLAQSESIGLHVRRGDYVTNPEAQAVHGSCGPDYYRRAVASLLPALRDPTVYVFSDDPRWVREHLKVPARTVVVDRHGPDAALADLRLMSRCRHFVIANSSFSWWAAWLATGAGKQVVAPGRWFADGRPTPDLLPAGWRTVSA